MVCPYCQHNDTAVVNSRQHKSQPKIWRRRRCVRCKTTFTTYELLAAKELPMVTADNGSSVSFSMPRLMISIYNVLPTSQTRADDSQALADSVYQQLSERSSSTLSTRDIANTTHTVLKRFNPRSGLSYGVAHNIITPDTLK